MFFLGEHNKDILKHEYVMYTYWKQNDCLFINNMSGAHNTAKLKYDKR